MILQIPEKEKPWRSVLLRLLGGPLRPLVPPPSEVPWDDAFRIANTRFIVRFLPDGGRLTINAMMVGFLTGALPMPPGFRPLLVCPYMSAPGRMILDAANQPWVDLAGNGRILLPGIRLNVAGEGHPPIRRGRPPSLFAPRSARIAHFLLLHHREAFRQVEIARATQLTEGLVSRVINGLEDVLLVSRSSGRVRCDDPDRLLDAWHEEDRFPLHRVLKCLLPARSVEETEVQLTEALTKAGGRHAFTGLSAAWHHAPFAGFRTVTCHLAGQVPPDLARLPGFMMTDSGANIWLVPNADEGIFLGAMRKDGIPIVDPLQTYIDLRAHPERSREAAEHLRRELIRWK